MQPGKTLRARMGWSPVVVVLVACLLGPSAAPAMVSAPGAGDLSPRLAELAKPAIRSLTPWGQARALGLAKEGPGSLLREGGRVLAEVRFDAGAGDAGELRQAGAKIASRSRRYKTTTIAVKPEDLHAVAAVPGVVSVTEVLTPLTFAAAGCPSGATVSEGDLQLRAAEARDQFEVDGSGVTVGILSDSFDRETTATPHAAEDVLTGDLPGLTNPCGHLFPVNNLDDSYAEGADEGRAMTQIVHDLAPAAKLAFATAFTGETAFAKNIERLAKPIAEGGAGAQVIADDVVYFDEPFFQDGPIAVAAGNVDAAGVDYFSAAGNDNLIDSKGRDIASWEAPSFRSAPSCPTALASMGVARCMDFNPSPEIADPTFGITVEPGSTLNLDLQWAEPWYGVATDLDAYLLDSEGNLIKVKGSPIESTEDNVAGGEPFEFLGWENTSSTSRQVQVVINRCSSSCNPSGSGIAVPRLKFALLENGHGVSAIEYPTSSGGDVVGPTIFGHAGAASAIAVGAVPFYTNLEPEEYSSRGPVTHYFGPVVGTTPAKPLETPETPSKPDLAATDCGVTTFFAFKDKEGKWRFCGTSAAAPHAAAVAALMLQKVPGALPAQVRAALSASAAPVGAYGPCAVGAGLVDAVGAIQQLLTPGSGSEPEPCLAPISEPGPIEHAVSPTGEPILPAEVPPPLPAPEPSPQALDATPPDTYIRRHPRKVVRTRRQSVRAVFGFAGRGAPTAFICRVDAGTFHICASRLARRFRIGRHVVRVKARDAAGNVDRTPAVYRFRVEQLPL